MEVEGRVLAGPELAGRVQLLPEPVSQVLVAIEPERQLHCDCRRADAPPDAVALNVYGGDQGLPLEEHRRHRRGELPLELRGVHLCAGRRL